MQDYEMRGLQGDELAGAKKPALQERRLGKG
jgi:hypothetical protein